MTRVSDDKVGASVWPPPFGLINQCSLSDGAACHRPHAVNLSQSRMSEQRVLIERDDGTESRNRLRTKFTQPQLHTDVNQLK
jgi:hypothetical protein